MDISRIAFEKLQNTRDLGQFTTKDGQKIKPRRLLRSGNLNDLNLEDRAILQNDYQLRTVIDLRTETEKEQEPDLKIAQVAYHWLPILDEATAGISREETLRADGITQLVSLLMQDTFDAKAYMTHTYEQFIINPFCRHQYRKFFQLLLQAPDNGSILWHCSAGKDRAGIVSVLVLSALGVDQDTIAEDYLATNTFYTETMNKMISLLTEKAGTKDIIPQIYAFFSVAPEYLDAALTKISAEFGNMDLFLAQELGLTPEKRIDLKNRFLMK